MAPCHVRNRDNYGSAKGLSIGFGKKMLTAPPDRKVSPKERGGQETWKEVALPRDCRPEIHPLVCSMSRTVELDVTFALAPPDVGEILRGGPPTAWENVRQTRRRHKLHWGRGVNHHSRGSTGQNRVPVGTLNHEQVV